MSECDVWLPLYSLTRTPAGPAPLDRASLAAQLKPVVVSVLSSAAAASAEERVEHLRRELLDRAPAHLR